MIETLARVGGTGPDDARHGALAAGFRAAMDTTAAETVTAPVGGDTGDLAGEYDMA